MKDRITIVADLLMAGAHADAHFSGEEKGVVRHLLSEILEVATLSPELERRIVEFDPAKFDLPAAAAAFAGDTADTKRRLLELLAAVHAADSEYDLAEDAFVRQVGTAIGLDEASYRDLTATVVEEIDIDLAADLEQVRRGQGP
jgi:uncharacterized tellurite resistance protein B-like protein